MNLSAVAEVVAQWAIVNAVALVLLAVSSYGSSILVLDWLHAWDKQRYMRFSQPRAKVEAEVSELW